MGAFFGGKIAKVYFCDAKKELHVNMKHNILLLMAFLGSCVGCQAQVSNQESFSAGGLYFEPTSDTTAKVVRPEMRRPNKPIPIMY